MREGVPGHRQPNLVARVVVGLALAMGLGMVLGAVLIFGRLGRDASKFNPHRGYNWGALTPGASSITVRGNTLRTGDTADDVFETLKTADAVEQDSAFDQKTGKLLPMRHYWVGEQSFTLVFARTTEQEPYRLIRIYNH